MLFRVITEGELCSYPQFRCLIVHRGDTWAKLWPNPEQREIVMRLNRTNEALSQRSWVVAPRNFSNININNLSPYPMQVEATGAKWIRVDLSKQAFAAYSESGRLLRWGPISAGRDYCADVGDECTTPTGTYQIQVKKGADCFSTLFPVDTKGGALCLIACFSMGAMPYMAHLNCPVTMLATVVFVFLPKTLNGLTKRSPVSALRSLSTHNGCASFCACLSRPTFV